MRQQKELFFLLNHSLFCFRASVSHRQKIKTKLRTEFELDNNSLEGKKSKTFCNPSTEKVSEYNPNAEGTQGLLICRSVSKSDTFLPAGQVHSRGNVL